MINKYPDEANGLIISLMERNAEEYGKISQSLIDTQADEIAVLKATLAAIRGHIMTLCDHPWTPNPMAILDALYPNQATISVFIERQKDD